MHRQNKMLLTVDAAVNIILGLLLLLFPFGIARYLGIPDSESAFYPTILGAVLLGIGLALLLERKGDSKGRRAVSLVDFRQFAITAARLGYFMDNRTGRIRDRCC